MQLAVSGETRVTQRKRGRPKRVAAADDFGTPERAQHGRLVVETSEISTTGQVVSQRVRDAAPTLLDHFHAVGWLRLPDEPEPLSTARYSAGKWLRDLADKIRHTRAAPLHPQSPGTGGMADEARLWNIACWNDTVIAMGRPTMRILEAVCVEDDASDYSRHEICAALRKLAYHRGY